MLFKLNKNKLFAMFLTILSLSVLGGCSTVTGLKDTISDKVFGREEPDAPEALADIQEKVRTRVLWSTKVGKAGDFEFSPTVEAGYVYAAGVEGALVKIDASTGSQMWQVNVGESISGGVGVGGSLVMVGTQKGAVYAYDLTGKELWKSNLSSEVLSVPVYFDGMVIVRTGDSKIYGINAEDGSRKWVYDRSGPSLTLRSSAGVVVDGGAVYAGFAGGKLIAVRADNGKLLWETAVAQPRGVTEIERISDITSLPIIDGPVVYAVAYQGRVASVDRRTGQILWAREISSLTGINHLDGRIYLSHTKGSIYSLDDQKGRSYWRQAKLMNRQLSTPLPIDSYVAFGDVEGYVHLLNQEDGAIDGRIRIGDSAIMPRLSEIDDSTFVAQSRDGVVYAVQIIKE